MRREAKRRQLFTQKLVRARSFVLDRMGSKSAAKIAMMAMTTSSSSSVNAR